MSVEVKIDWSEMVELEGEVFSQDFLDRAKYADFLTKYLQSQNKAKPYVLNLNSSWGTGKSYFLKRWAHDLKASHPVIYIDAWKDDHSDDPFMTVISSIISGLRKLTDKPETSALSKGIENSWSLLKAMGPLLVGAAAKKYLGKDIDEIASLMDSDSTDISKEVGDAANKMAQFLISSYEKKNESVKALKADVKEWMAAVIGQSDGARDYPTIVIIDELDRCRPSYAVEMLEAVKHIFDIPGMFFVIATDTEQLQHAIKVVYGSDFDAQTYLSRFFDTRFSLRQASLKGLIESHCDATIISREYCDSNGIVLWPRNNNQLDNIISVLDSFNLSPRLAIQIVTRITASIANIRRGSIIDIIYLTILHCIRVTDYSIYNGLIGTLRIGDFDILFKGRSYFHSDSKFKIDIDYHNSHIIEMSLSKYFESIFLYVSDVFDGKGAAGSMVRGMKPEKIIESINQERGVGDFSIDNERFNIRLLQCEYLIEKLHKKNKGIYKDLVELSAAFE